MKEIEKRRKKVLELIKQGKSKEEISEIVGMSIWTIENDIKELKKHGEIMDKPEKLNEDIDMLCREFTGQARSLKIFDQYILYCKNQFNQKKLTDEEIKLIKKITFLTNNYDYVVFCIKLDISKRNLKDALKTINIEMNNKNFSQEQREKIAQMKDDIKKIKQKVIAIRYLKAGYGVEQAENNEMNEETLKNRIKNGDIEK